MKRITMIIVALIAITASASAMSYKSAREQALFLTDKMAYELNLTDDQYNAAYEINLDYLMNMSTSGDLYGSFWTWRNQELSYVLSSAQYATYLATTYFYRPLSWVSNRFSLLIYGHYPKGRYFRSAPPVYHTYRGGNRIYQHSPYKGRTFGDYKNIQPRVTNRPAGNQPKGGQQPGVGNRHTTVINNTTVNNNRPANNGRTVKQGRNDNSAFGGNRAAGGNFTKKEAIKQGRQQMEKKGKFGR